MRAARSTNFKSLLALLWFVSIAPWIAASPLSAAPTVREVVDTYANIALAAYEDSLTAAKALRTAIDKLAKAPSAQTLDEARSAWKAARVPYMQTEAFQIGRAHV